MSTKNFVSYGDAETLFTGVGSELSSLKSGLTNVADDVKLNTNDLTTPSRTKNLLPMTLNGIKSANTTGTWSGNAYTVNGVTFTVQTDSDGNVAGININGTTTGGATFNIANNVSIPLNGTYKFMGNSDFSTGTAANTFVFGNISEISTYNNAKTETISDNFTHAHIYLWSNKTFNNVMVYPMFMLDSESSDDFAPYIPSVESRIEAVEKGNVSHEILKSSTSVWSGDTLTFTVAPENNRMWRLVAGVSYSLGTKFVEAYIVIRAGDSGAFIYNAHGTVTATYDYTTGVLTVTLPESSHWVYRMELAAAYYD